MGQGLCHRRAASFQIETPSKSAFAEESSLFGARLGSEMALPDDRSFADQLCQSFVLSYSRVARQTIMGAKTLGELREYVSDLRSRESMLNGYDGEGDRVKEGLTGFGRY
mmetsp:Transcript_24232/g.38773  ORF Transcript_24232/g.38773 Transcript_24232/m.38773 type:complete len:110 (-) Transcript_24232:123-452(-)|eukprot:CAMPEP_0169117404 /NCGR_PEP_ID=MMETSP1015-20121227/30439_1 /TAXON_ID=342587 /ORGANISM="Karlodinium micrum, Strain CCMP2283" /LENGTH=109 /DNA_ID=CAMNT_0009180083 /DNA_START=139 /DNA_END=468 /DNA_ORIENTATION=+